MGLLQYECWVCGVVFGMTEETRKRYTQRGGTFYCVNGCKLGFGESTVDKLTRELASAKAEAERQTTRRCAAEQKALRYKCTECVKDYASAEALRKHVRLVHQSPLKLPKDAGPSALNTKVN